MLKRRISGFILIIGLLFIFYGNFTWAAGHPIVSPLRVHYMGDSGMNCIFIRTPNHHTVLINSGDCNISKIDSYFKVKKVKQIDILLIPHPNQVYFENISKIVQKYKIGEIYVATATMDNQTDIEMQNLRKAENVTIENIQGGHFINIDPALMIEFFAPNRLKYDTLEDGEPVLKIMYNRVSFLFCGTISHISEREMLKRKYDLKADVVEFGSINNQNSLTQKFLKKVSPQYAVITAGSVCTNDNPGYLFGQLLKAGVNFYRTDSEWTIIFSTDGQKIKIQQDFR